jgi:hypothetical protein
VGRWLRWGEGRQIAQILHSLGDVSLLEKGGAFSLGRDHFLELLDLVAELDGQRIRLNLAGLADGFHSIATRILYILLPGEPDPLS